MIFAFFVYWVPYIVPWIVVFNTIYSQNGFGTMISSSVGGTFITLLPLLFSFIMSMLSADRIGPCTISRVRSGRTGTMSVSLARIVINYILVLLLAPFKIVIGFFKIFFRKNNEYPENVVSANVLAFIALILAIIPFSVQTWAVLNFDCNKLEYELVDVSSETTEVEHRTYFDIEVRYPEKELSGIEGDLYIYVDGKIFHSVTLREEVNPAIPGLLQISPGDKEDVNSITFNCGVYQRINKKNNIVDLQALFNQRSDRLRIDFKLKWAAFHNSTVGGASGSKYIENIGTITVYSAKEYYQSHDLTDENKALYNSAIDLYNNKKYAESLEILQKIPFYSDAKNYISLCQDALKEEKYLSALALMNNEKYDEAIEAFSKLTGYKDSAAKISECESKKLESFYLGAIEKYNCNKLLEALADFSEIEDYKESTSYITQIKNKISVASRELAVNGKYREAMDMLEAIETPYEDDFYVACSSAYKGNYAPLVNMLEIKKVIVEDGTEEIYDRAFVGCENITEVVLPSSVTTIGELAFYGCSSLERINLPEGITQISDAAFKNCTSLKEITLPVSLKSCGNNILSGCSSLQKVKTPFNENFSMFAFLGDSSNIAPTALITIEITSGSVIPEGFFSYLPATVANIIYCEPITEIGAYAFRGSSLNIVIPPTVKKIGKGAFEDMPSVSEIVIPEGVEEIGDDAFCETTSLYLKKVYLPSTLKKLGTHCFVYNYNFKHSVTEIYFAGTKAEWLALESSGTWNKNMYAGSPTYKLFCEDAVCIFDDSNSGRWENLP